MRLKLYRAANMAAAMAKLRTDLGPDALIVSTRRTGDGVELTAALEPEEAVAQPPLRADLAWHGIPAHLAARLAGPDLEASLADLLRFGPLPLEERGGPARPLLLAGLPGAGKTLSLARLATRMVLAGLRPAVITTDDRRAGTAEELAAYTRLLGLELLVASTPASLTRALAVPACRTGAPVLIDSAGVNPAVPAELAALVALAQAADASPVLVMAAGQHAEEAAEHARAFAPLAARHLLPTRLDLTRRLGSLIAAAAGEELILTEAGAGPGATDTAVTLTAAYLANRLVAASPQAGAEAPKIFRTPVFPAARSQRAQSWSTDRHG